MKGRLALWKGCNFKEILTKAFRWTFRLGHLPFPHSSKRDGDIPWIEFFLWIKTYVLIWGKEHCQPSAEQAERRDRTNALPSGQGRKIVHNRASFHWLFKVTRLCMLKMGLKTPKSQCLINCPLTKTMKVKWISKNDCSRPKSSESKQSLKQSRIFFN